ncbi:MAG TPA: hypothetical protein VNH18_08780 [Bryobacteraceae bacterium]|nr:hypothetical protein [Bryobacteraceae bacterium]
MKTLAEFTANDSAYLADRAFYTALTADFDAALQPSGILELTFAAEILRATWRLQRLPVGDMDLDQPSTDHFARLRTGIQTTIRWAMTELRRLQTARVIRDAVDLPNTIGLADPKEIVKATRQPSRPLAQQPAQTAGEPRTAPAANPATIPPSAVDQMEAMLAGMLDRSEREQVAAFNRQHQGAGHPAAVRPSAGLKTAA